MARRRSRDQEAAAHDPSADAGLALSQELRDGESPRAYRRRIRMADAGYRRAVRLRRTLLLVSALPVLLLLVVGTKLISLAVINAWGASAYDSGRYATATKRFSWNSTVNVFDPYVQLFNEGTAAMRNSHFADAEALLEEALTVVPEKHVCDVRSNLALTIMFQGDLQRSLDNFEEANRLYTKAMDAWMVEPCWTPPEEPPPPDDLGEQLQERKDQNQQDLEDQGGQGDGSQGDQGGQGSTGPSSPGSTGPSRGGTPGPGGTSPSQGGSSPGTPGSGGSSTPTPSDGKEQDLQDRNDKAQQDRDAERQRNGGGGATKGW